ncbi:glycosyltransferase [Falsibacillus pallidus]|uniref:Glycosyl transferase family 1 n=1 Tax=Falsibacillus pallidus TaxID=493781 RepID=A0A370GF05_9BACI|nr:glycosyltransferase [Falsibacillus pallidus]RDI41850.1 glycosyl transferase family 1 [Falsibacillus pallidus]
MPTSFYQAIPEIIEHIRIDEPSSILDVGVGFGKYGVLLREVFDIPFERYEKKSWQLQIDGIEGFAGYRNPLHEYVYNQVIYGNLESVIDQMGDYDTILLIDVLEHFEKPEGLEIIQKLLAHANKSLIISTPLYPEPQGDYLGNTLETHKSRWNLIDFLSFDFTYKQLNIGENGALLFKILPPEKTKIPADPPTKKKLKIAYVLPHLNLTGGLKMLLHQMEQLRKRGHQIYAVYKGDPGTRAVPNWYPIEVDGEIIVPPNESYVRHIEHCDIIVTGWYQQIPELLDLNEKTFYWEQGHNWLFGDYPNLYEAQWIRQEMKNLYQTAIRMASVSSTVSTILKARYQKETEIIPNGVDTKFYFPLTEEPKEDVLTILLVGNPFLRFKGFDVALKALRHVRDLGYQFKVKWVCQHHPDIGYVPFPIEYVIHPSQEELRNHYQMAHIFLFTSIYEGFGMPPLEAMSCGIPVITTRCGGVNEYAGSDNSLQIEPGDHLAASQAIITLLESSERRNELREKGRETALKFSFDRVIEKMERFMYEIDNQNEVKREQGRI